MKVEERINKLLEAGEIATDGTKWTGRNIPMVSHPYQRQEPMGIVDAHRDKDGDQSVSVVNNHPGLVKQYQQRGWKVAPIPADPPVKKKPTTAKRRTPKKQTDEQDD